LLAVIQAADGDQTRHGARPSPYAVMMRARRGRTLPALLVAPVLLALAACGTTDQASKETLPPIRTTTSTTPPSTTTIPEGARFYVIKRGDTLARIAASFNVTVQSIVDLNGLQNADAIQAGQTIEIPTGVVVIDELPEQGATTTVG
jgi:nucleoid-associated protein YgaU